MKNTILLFILFFPTILCSQSLKEINNTMVEFYSQGDYVNAILFAEKAIKQANKEFGQKHPEYAASLNNLAVLYNNVGNYKAALPLQQEAKNLILQVSGEKHPDYAASLNNLATLYQAIGNYKAALPLLEEAKNLFMQVSGEKHPDYASSLNNLASLYYEIGNYKAALPLFEEAKNIRLQFLGNKHPHYAQSLSHLAGLYEQIGNYTAALPLFEEAKNLRLQVLGQKHPDYANSLNNLALLYQKIGNYKAAIPLYKEAINIRLKVLGKRHPDYANSLNSLAYLFYEVGNFKAARPLLEETNKIRLQVLGKRHPDYANSLNNLAKLYYMEKAFDKCKDKIIQATEITMSNFDNLDILSEKQKIDYIENEKQNFQVYYSLSLQLFYHDKSIAVNLLNTNLFTQSLLLSSSKQLKENILKSKDRELIELYNEYVDSKTVLARAYSLTGEETNYFKINVDSLENVSDNYERELAKKTRVFEKYLNKRNNSWEDIRVRLKPNEAAVSILRFPYYNKGWTDTIKYAALIVTNETVDHPNLVELQNGPELEGRFFEQYSSSMLPGKGTNQSKESFTTYKAFWEEIEKEIEGKDVVYLSPDGVYHTINLNTIQYPDGKFLYEKKDIVISNSLLELLDEEEPLAHSKTAMLVGNPDFSMDKESQKLLAANFLNNNSGSGSYSLSRDFRDYSLNALPGTKIEVEKINGLLKEYDWETQYLTGKQALEEAIKSVKNPQVLHIATHGFFADNIQPNNLTKLNNSLMFGQNRKKAIENPMLRSALMLSGSVNALNGKYDPLSQMDDGILTGYEAMSLELDGTELVVLSACETGLGEVRDGEGVYGLQRAFRLAGAKNIIMSLWKVDDIATQLLMRKFYEYWLEGNTKREAFKQAQDHLRTQTAYKDPYYWGGFVYIGMDRPEGIGSQWINEQHNYGRFFWLLIIIPLLALMVYFRKRIFGTI
jgi:CHAT domain-containing protein